MVIPTYTRARGVNEGDNDFPGAEDINLSNCIVSRNLMTRALWSIKMSLFSLSNVGICFGIYCMVGFLV